MIISSQQIHRIRKEGRVEDAWNCAVEALSRSPRDRYIQNAYGWVVYDRLKRIAETPVDDNNRAEVVRQVTFLAREYGKLKELKRPDLLHSMILGVILKCREVWPSFLPFARWWGTESFLPQDFEVFVTDEGKRISSLRQRFFTSVGSALVKTDSVDSDLEAWAENVIDRGMEEYPRSVFLPYFKGRVLERKGKKSDAEKFYIRALQLDSRSDWLWARLGGTFRETEPQKAVVCYAKAVRLCRNDNAVVGRRVALAEALLGIERYADAARQVTIALDMSARQEVKTRSKLSAFEVSDWYSAYRERPSDADPACESAERVFLFGDDAPNVAIRAGVVDFQSTEKRFANVALGPEEWVKVFYDEFDSVKHFVPGTLVEIKSCCRRIRSVKKCERKEVEGFCRNFEGVFTSVTDSRFGFLDTDPGVFVPPPLVSSGKLAHGMRVRCRAVYTRNRRRDTLGWKALTVEPCGEAEGNGRRID